MKYFTIEELCKSRTATEKGIKNVPDATEKARMVLLVDKILDPLREAWGAPIIVTSGFRCDKLNKLVGGATNSQHRRGEAADIHTKSDTPEDNKKLWDLIIKLKLPFDQMINEQNFNWVHVSYGPRKRRKKLDAVKKNGRWYYTLSKY